MLSLVCGQGPEHDQKKPDCKRIRTLSQPFWSVTPSSGSLMFVGSVVWLYFPWPHWTIIGLVQPDTFLSAIIHNINLPRAMASMFYGFSGSSIPYTAMLNRSNILDKESSLYF